MAKRKKSDPADKRKPVNVRPIERKHAGKVTEPYKIMEALIPEHHEHLKEATILLCYRRGWKPDVDRVLTLAKIKKASDLDRALGSRFGDSYDFVIQLNEDAWAGLDDEKKRLVIDHELCHAKPDLDRDGNQKLDARERLCWRCRKHPIQEFPEIIERYGVDVALGMNQTALDAAEEAQTPLFAGLDDGEGESLDWREAPLETLRAKTITVTEAMLTKLSDAGIENLGQLADCMDGEGTWWHKGVKGIGKETAAPIEDALAAIRAGHAKE